MAAAPHDSAERRQLTVMLCDLAGSTALSVKLDPEDLRGIIAAYHCCCSELVERNGGFVAKYMGDGVRARPVQATTRSGARTLPLVSGPKKAAAAQAMQPIQVPMIIGSANPVPRCSARKVNTSGTKPPKIAAWW
jgi:class 3 adenylate cyclase